MPEVPKEMPSRRTGLLWTIRAGLVAFVLFGVFPPWVERMDVPYRVHVERSEGYGLIVSPPPPWVGGPFDYRASVHIDWSRLMLEWIILAGIVAAAAAWRSKSEGDRSCRRQTTAPDCGDSPLQETPLKKFGDPAPEYPEKTPPLSQAAADLTAAASNFWGPLLDGKCNAKIPAGVAPKEGDRIADFLDQTRKKGIIPK